MSLKELLQSLADYKFDFEKAHINIYVTDNPPCLVFTKIKEILASHSIAEIYESLNKLYMSALITNTAYRHFNSYFEHLYERLYRCYVDKLTVQLAMTHFKDKKLSSLREKILNDYEFDFRNVNETSNYVCYLYRELDRMSKIALNSASLDTLFCHLCHIKIIIFAKEISLSELAENSDDTFLYFLRSAYYDIADDIRVLASMIAREVSEQ